MLHSCPVSCPQERAAPCTPGGWSHAAQSSGSHGPPAPERPPGAAAAVPVVPAPAGPLSPCAASAPCWQPPWHLLPCGEPTNQKMFIMTPEGGSTCARSSSFCSCKARPGAAVHLLPDNKPVCRQVSIHQDDNREARPGFAQHLHSAAQ